MLNDLNIRKMTSVKTITNLTMIPDSDFIELATVNNGWDVVVKKGSHKINEQVVYFEIDSIIPASDDRFLTIFSQEKPKNYQTNNGFSFGWKLHTKKIRGKISQGLIMPLSEFPEINENNQLDLDNLLNIQKHEPYIESREAKGTFPYYIKKTSLERVQNIWDEISLDEKFYATLKVDGLSMTIFNYENDGKNTGVCSNGVMLKEDKMNAYTNTAKNFKILEKIQKFNFDNFSELKFKTPLNNNIAIQGEVYGLGLEKNREKIKTIEFVGFNIYSIDNQQSLLPQNTFKIFEDMNIPHVPVIYKEKSLRELGVSTLADLLELANLESLHGQIAEGLVFRSCERDFAFKVINNQYLCKYK